MDFNPELLLSKLHLDLSFTSGLSQTRGEFLKRTILKKFVPMDRKATLSSAAINDFIERNWAMHNSFVVPSDLDAVFRTWRDILHRVFLSGEMQTNTITLDKCVELGYTGPGASIGTTHTDFVGKMFNSKLTYTDKKIYRHYCSRLSPRWQQAESIRSACYSEGVVAGNKLSTVPKDKDRERTICTEPSLNMFYQLGAKFIIEGLLKKYYDVDVSKQPEINKLMAKCGSAHGGFATIDLKNASDSIHLGLCEYLLPKETYEVLCLLRSPGTTVGGEFHYLSMISTMGNGFTFPLMTIMFCSLFEALCVHTGRKAIAGVNFSVFGDDIIVPVLAYDEYVVLLEAAGFTVNSDKSFSTGPFRESCGGDYYLGHDVRGIYLKELSCEAHVYSLFNRLLRWSLKHDISLYHTLRYVKGLVDFRPVPLYSNDDHGFKVPESVAREYLPFHNGRYRYRCIVPVPRKIKYGDSCRNPFGALIGAVGGYLRSNSTAVRENKPVRYRVEKRWAFNWNSEVNPHWDGQKLHLTIPSDLINLREMSCVWSMLLSIDH